MNLEDVIDPEYGPVNSVHSLQQDDWSLHGGENGGPPRFGKDSQLGVIGWSGRDKGGKGNKYYILKCHTCAKDNELHGEGVFRSLKGGLVKGTVPCGCSCKPEWTPSQYTTLCKRAAEKLGHTFTGFVGEWNGKGTKIAMVCDAHGEWGTGSINSLINQGAGCPGCKADATGLWSIKPNETMIESFMKSEAFHHDTKFWRSDRLTSQGWASYWYVSCPECGETGESFSGDLQQGKRPCACSKQRQQECYINWIVDSHNNAVALKFGIARDSKQRIKQQDSKSAYILKQHSVYAFPSVEQCKKAERECKKELECGIVLKRDMPDGWTETTWSYNIGKVKSIYERNGGVLV